MLIIIEGLVMCFLLLLVCVVGIADGPVGLVVLYEQNIQDRAVELGLTSKERIRKSFVVCCLSMFAPVMYDIGSFHGLLHQWRGWALEQLSADDGDSAD